MKLLVIGFIIGIIITILFNKMYSSNNENNSEEINNIIRSLVKQCSRWYVASLQDKSPLIATLHSNYATGYFWALTDVFTTEQIKKAMNFTNADYLLFKKKIISGQEITTKKISKICPAFIHDLDIEMAKLAGDI